MIRNPTLLFDRIQLLTIVWLILAAHPSLAALLRVPGSYPTIQAGLDAASCGDTVLVADGLYSGPGNASLSFQGKNLILVSENGADSCTIDGSGAARGFMIVQHEAEPTVIQGFTICSCQADDGGAIHIANGSWPSIKNCLFISNSSCTGGAIAILSDSGVNLVGCRFLDNTAETGGAIAIREGGWLAIRACTFETNYAETDGGAIYSSRSVTTVTGSSFFGNASTAGAGGGYYGCVDSRVSLRDCHFSNNYAYVEGGAAFIFGVAGGSTVVDCLFEANCTNSELAGYGGAVSCAFAQRFERCGFSHNHGRFGGALGTYSGDTEIHDCWFHANHSLLQAGALYCGFNSSAVIADCRFEQNTSFSGGAIFAYESSQAMLIANSAFINNMSYQSGGAIYGHCASNTLSSCIFAGNRALTEQAGALFIRGDVEIDNCLIINSQCALQGGAVFVFSGLPTFRHCTICDNTSLINSGHQLVLRTLLGEALMQNCIVGNWQSSDQAEIEDNGGNVTIQHSAVHFGWPGTGNIDADPLFVQAGNRGLRDYYLSSMTTGQLTDSPCVDSGSALASAIEYPGSETMVSLSAMTTRLDHRNDEGLVDMGYHYAGVDEHPPLPTLGFWAIVLLLGIFSLRLLG